MYLAGLRTSLRTPPTCEVILLPPFTSLFALDEALKGTPYKLGAQHCHWEESGAFTGEISPSFLQDLNVEYVAVGHSERREYFGETDEMVNKKTQAIFRHHMKPIVCIGETLKERQQNETLNVIERQVKKTLEGQLREDLGEMIWAYEPRWAIGTGKNATPEQAQEVANYIRGLNAKILDGAIANQMRILYGGSVTEATAKSFLSLGDVDGLLVGGASLDPARFSAIIRAV